MGISRYLAMTAAEMEAFSVPDGWVAAYMACHFSPYNTGLSNIPQELPPGSMLILNDRTPISGHDPQRIVGQLSDALEQLAFDSLLLDFERAGCEDILPLCQVLVEQLPCPVGISSQYAQALECPVFLPPPPLDQPLAEYILPWQDRELWLDTAPGAGQFIITEDGSAFVQLPFSQASEKNHTDASLHCRYWTEISENEVRFHIWRDLPQIELLIDHAQSLSITKCIGLYQELFTQKSTLSK